MFGVVHDRVHVTHLHDAAPVEDDDTASEIVTYGARSCVMKMHDMSYSCSKLSRIFENAARSETSIIDTGSSARIN